MPEKDHKSEILRLGLRVHHIPVTEIKVEGRDIVTSFSFLACSF